MNRPILGWDVGGANLKAARIVGNAPESLTVVERPFALWREPERLTEMLTNTASRLGTADEMAVTMTAELADCFATKAEGVTFVVEAFRAAFPDIPQWFYAVDGQFRSPALSLDRPIDLAATNWLAVSTLIGRTVPDAIVIDVGSTTTDVVPIVGGRVVAHGYTDLARLQSGELVYTGILRTPVCAIVRSVPLSQHDCRVAAEVFAIAADVYRWLEQIDDAGYTCDTPDGRGTGRAESGARLARMVCADAADLDPADVTAFARHIVRAQTTEIASALQRVARRIGSTAPRLAVLAGRGEFLARAAAREVAMDVISLADQLGADAARTAPAAAVALLLAATSVH